MFYVFNKRVHLLVKRNFDVIEMHGTTIQKNVLNVAFFMSVMSNLTAVAVLLQWCTDLCLILPGLRIYYIQVVHLFIVMLLRYINILF
jgi:hypothetical protein